MTTRLTPYETTTSLDHLAVLIKDIVEAISPEERAAMAAEQRRSWVRGELMLENPAMTRAEADALMDRATSPPRPIRLQLSRKAGFNLQEASRAANGLEATVVTRTTIWGNGFSVGSVSRHLCPDGRRVKTIEVATVEEAIHRYRRGLLKGKRRMALLHTLRGKNLACNCKPGAPCHADVLLELANAAEITCERVT